MEQFWTIFNTKNFSLCHNPSLTVQEVEISKGHEDGEKWWVTIWSTKSKWDGIGPDKPGYLVRMRVFLQSSVENLGATWLDVLFCTHERFCWIQSYMLFLFCCNNDDVIMCSGLNSYSSFTINTALSRKILENTYCFWIQGFNTASQVLLFHNNTVSSIDYTLERVLEWF